MSQQLSPFLQSLFPDYAPAALAILVVAVWFSVFNVTGNGKMEREESPNPKACLGPHERQLLRLAKDLHGSQRVGVLVSYDRALDLEKLKSAARKMQKRHPISACKLDITAGCITPCNDALIQVTEHKRTGGDSWRRVWDLAQSRPLEDLALMMRLEVIISSESDKDSCELILVAEHICTDGVSLMNWVHELNLAMEDPTIEWDPRPLIVPSQMALLDVVYPSYVERAKGLASFALELATKLSFVSFLPREIPQPSSGAMQEDFSLPVLTADPVHVDPTTTERLSQMAKSRGITIHPVLMAALFRALANIIAPEKASKMVVSSVYNLRGRLPKGLGAPDIAPNDLMYAATSGYFGRTVGGPCYASASALWDLAQGLHEEASTAVKDGSLLVNSWVGRLTLMPLPLDSPGVTCTVSNWGRSPLNKFYQGVGRVDRLQTLLKFSGLATPYVAFCSTNGVLDISVIGSQRHFKQSQLQSIANETRRCLDIMLQ